MVFGALAFAGWAMYATHIKLSKVYETHRVEIPMPFPLSEAEITALREERKAADPPPSPEAPPIDYLEGVDLNAIAMERAVARGQHLVESRFVCVECHGANFGGGTMVDDPLVGQLLGPNLTLGKGSRTLEYTMADWDRMVRHGVRPDGTPGLMPSDDFVGMADRELSDIVAYIRSLPPVDAEVPPVSLGPLLVVLCATGEMEIEADKVLSHPVEHPVDPPEVAATAEFGAHAAQVCTGCHRSNFEGGPIVGAPPDWAPARNITPHAEGIQGWTYEQFVAALRESKRPDGTALREPMTKMAPYAAKMSDTELQGLWAYLQTVPAVPQGK